MKPPVWWQWLAFALLMDMREETKEDQGEDELYN